MNAIKKKLNAKTVMELIDHTLLKPYADVAQIDSFVREGSRLGAYSVCIQPVHAKHVRELIDSNNYNLKLAVVVDFPHGSLSTAARRAVIRSLAGTADEIDVVVQIGLAKSGKFDEILEDLKELTAEAHMGKMKLKVITEDAYFTMAEKERIYEAVFKSGADFIKTSTGFAESKYAVSIGNATTGAEAENVRLMRKVSERLGKQNVGIKVAGGVRTYAQILELLEASGRRPDPDHFRVGASGTIAIYEELKDRK